MSKKVLVVSPPDDIYNVGCRILLVDLTGEQSKIVSDAILASAISCPVIIYNWMSADTSTWLFDKIYKSSLIIFNADSVDQTLIGFIASRPSSFYFGNLKTINQINKNAILYSNQCNDIIANTLLTYGN